MSTRQCAFIQARACPVDVDEIPLDVCRLCVDAWKTSAEIQTLTGANLLGPTILVPAGMPAQPQYVPTTPMQPQMAPQLLQTAPHSAPPQPFTLVPDVPDTVEPAKEAYEMLHRLDNQFINDQISADDYVSMRRSLVDHLSDMRKADGEEDSFLTKATSAGYITPDPDEVTLPPAMSKDFKVIDLGNNLEMLNGYGKHFKRVLPLLLIERNKKGKIGVVKHPTEWKIPSSLNRSNLESIYELYDQLREDQEKILLQFNGTKLGLLGKKNNRILCMVLDSEESVEDYTDEVNYLTDLLSSTNTVDDFVSALQKAMDKTKDLSI
jgi:hypothetical protein